MLVLLFAALAGTTALSVGLCVQGDFDTAWYFILSGLMLTGLLLNEIDGRSWSKVALFCLRKNLLKTSK